ncbi:putative TOS1-like glycosyl hydrolase-domain-containing protein [Podospora australis]|uniref:glucan endo-1,3-beta-D-glucosidase n=1 Tax=Podospora australis TaxID=1536484 RepID=A0AAN6X3Q4_9PEZI|nr:putative TOS1-like glycosyl hydrolase-domain-containing protein [Podospora australis]
MRDILEFLAALLAFAGTANGGVIGHRDAQKCSQDVGGNQYCNAVTYVSYQVAAEQLRGYKEVTGMDFATGQCTYAERSVSGPLAPFNEPLSIHFRGPIRLKQFAVYIPHSDAEKFKKRNSAAKMTKKDKEIVPLEKRAKKTVTVWETETVLTTEYLTVTAAEGVTDGCVMPTTFLSTCTSVVSNISQAAAAVASTEPSSTPFASVSTVPETTSTTTSMPSSGPAVFTPFVPNLGRPSMITSSTSSTSASTSSTVEPVASSTTRISSVKNVTSSLISISTAEPLSSSSIGTPPTPSQTPESSSFGLGDFQRIGYYDAEAQTSEGITFLGNFGATGISGTWSTTFGNSQSFVNSNATGPSASPQIIADTLIPSRHEFAIMTDQPCGDDGSCGFVQPGAPAFKGFPSAPQKVFLMEFSMPHETGPDLFLAEGRKDAQWDAPAVWLLNARIPYTQQYGNCSCWHTGCGEFDIFEALEPGEDRVLTSVHAQYRAGARDYLMRPTAETMQLAVVLDEVKGTLEVKVLEDLPREMMQVLASGFKSFLSDFEAEEITSEPDGTLGSSKVLLVVPST